MNIPVEPLAIEASTGIYPVEKWQYGRGRQQQDCVAEEVPVALIYNGISHAVMLATPQDLADFALGFSLCEGILASADELYGVEIVPQHNGIALQLDIASERFQYLKERRRSIAGRTGCGLCGAESLEQAMRIPTPLAGPSPNFNATAIHLALQDIRAIQALQLATGATHASAWVDMDGSIGLIREDVGRHNALDKLIGALALQQMQRPAGFILTTSRASYEMVQKTASAGVAMLVAISAPTGLAIRIAQDCGITLVGFARDDQYVVYSHGERIMHEEMT